MLFEIMQEGSLMRLSMALDIDLSAHARELRKARAAALREAKEAWRKDGWAACHDQHQVETAEDSAQAVVLWLDARADKEEQG